MRIISVNRREYPGSSPYSPEELTAVLDGTEAERANLLEQQGRDLELLVDGLIEELLIPQAGGIALVGRSMGTIFALSLISSTETLPAATKVRLSNFVHTVIMLRSFPAATHLFLS